MTTTRGALRLAERWLPIPGVGPGYEASDQGRVRSCKSGSWHILTPVLEKRDGYFVVSINRRAKRVHWCVTRAFYGEPMEGQMCRHLDGTRTNNVLSNLRFGTASENMQDAVRHGTNVNTAKTHCPRGHEYTEQNTYRYAGRPRRECRACWAIKDREKRALREAPAA